MEYNEHMHELGNWHEPLRQQHFTPGLSLSPFVRSFHLLTGQQELGGQQHWYILPDNTPHLIFHLYEQNGRTYPSLRIIGARSKHQLINRAQRSFTLICAFRPGGLYPFCQLPIHELTDCAMDARVLFPVFNDEVMAELSRKATSMEIRPLIQQIEYLLMPYLSAGQRSLEFVQALRQIQHQPMIRVSELASQLGISERHLRSISKKYIGHGPKVSLQIERFTRSLHLSKENREWSHLALDSGYYDQSHLIADYQKMVGTTPEKLFAS